MELLIKPSLRAKRPPSRTADPPSRVAESNPKNCHSRESGNLDPRLKHSGMTFRVRLLRPVYPLAVLAMTMCVGI